MERAQDLSNVLGAIELPPPILALWEVEELHRERYETEALVGRRVG
jgi:hypothetical protein